MNHIESNIDKENEEKNNIDNQDLDFMKLNLDFNDSPTEFNNEILSQNNDYYTNSNNIKLK